MDPKQIGLLWNSGAKVMILVPEASKFNTIYAICHLGWAGHRYGERERERERSDFNLGSLS